MANPKPEAILKWAHPPIAMLGELWEAERQAVDGRETGGDPLPRSIFSSARTTRIAKVVYRVASRGQTTDRYSPGSMPELAQQRWASGAHDSRRHQGGRRRPNRRAKGDEITLDAIHAGYGRQDGLDPGPQGAPVYPERFEELAEKLERPLHPPGRDVRCIVSVGMLTEGWDCNTVTHIVGLAAVHVAAAVRAGGRSRSRGARVTNVGEDGKLTEEVAKVFGVPFEVIPFKANAVALQRQSRSASM